MLNNSTEFNLVFQKHWTELYCYAYNITRDKAIAEDIVQDVFTDYWKRQVRAEMPRAYLFRAIKNQCAKAMINERFNTVQVEKLAALIPDLEGDEYEELKQKLLQEINQTAVRVLPERCLKIFKMRFYEQLTYKDIAKQLGIKESTVENQINKALKLLKDSTVYISETRFSIVLVLSMLI